MSLRFLSEVSEDVELIVESIETPMGVAKSYYLEGIFLQCDVKNRNGRIYPLQVVMPEVDRYLKEYIIPKRAMGELGHPPNVGINLERVSHLITDLRQMNKDFIGRAKLMTDTPYGKLAIGLVSEGVKLGVSSRAGGNTVSRNGAKVVENFRLVTVDIVADPSAPDAFVNAILENKEYYFENGILKEKQYDEIQKEVKAATKTQLTEGKLLEIFENYIKTLM